MRILKSLHNLHGDLFGGVTVTVVMLPIGLAYGAASGLGPITGLYSAIAAGFFAAVFGGTPARVAAPTAPMTVAMSIIVTQHATSLAEAFTIVMLAGLMQVLMGLLGVGRLVVYTPYSVVAGFTSGIGVIIMLMQTLPLVGLPAVPGGAVGALRAWPQVLGRINTDALCVAAVTLAIGIFWPRHLRKHVPAPLAALIIGTLACVLLFRDAPVIGEVPTGRPDLHLPVLSGGFLVRALEPAFMLAMVGSLSSLLLSLLADSLTRTRHQPSRELIGQGIGNIAAALVGGLPAAGSNQATTANIRSGGRTPVSGVLVAAGLLAIILGLEKFVEPIPHAALAGILVKVGWDIIDWRLLGRARRVERHHLLVMVVTLGLTVFVDLLTAVAIGLIAAGLAGARQLERRELGNVLSVPLLDRSFLPESASPQEDADPYSARVGMVALRGAFSVASARQLTWVISADIRDHEVVVFDFSDTTAIDDSAALVIEQLIGLAADENKPSIVMGLSGPAADTLHGLDALAGVPGNHFVGSLDKARQLAKRLLDP